MKSKGFEVTNGTNMFEVIFNNSYGVVPVICHLYMKSELIYFPYFLLVRYKLFN